MKHLPTFPSAISAVASRLQSGLAPASFFPSAGFDVCVGGERLCVPARIYGNEQVLLARSASPDDYGVFAACLGTLHADGRIREACLRRLHGIQRSWVDPFVIASLADYVIEVAELAASAVRVLDPVSLAMFANENPAFIAVTRCRAISYWNCYYRNSFSEYRKYPPVAALDAIAVKAAATRTGSGSALNL